MPCASPSGRTTLFARPRWRGSGAGRPAPSPGVVAGLGVARHRAPQRGVQLLDEGRQQPPLGRAVARQAGAAGLEVGEVVGQLAVEEAARILARGADKAREKATRTLELARDRMGLRY